MYREFFNNAPKSRRPTNPSIEPSLDYRYHTTWFHGPDTLRYLCGVPKARLVKMLSSRTYNKAPLNLSDWSQVEKYIARRSSRESRVSVTLDLLREVRAAIQEHDHQFRKLTGQGELVMPEEAAEYGDDLRNVEWHLQDTLERYVDLQQASDSDDQVSEIAHSGAGDGVEKTAETTGQQSDLLTLGDVASILGISESKVYKMSAAREIPVTKIGRAVRVRRGDLQEWLHNNTTKRRNRGSRRIS